LNHLLIVYKKQIKRKNMLTIKELQDTVPDLIGKIYMEGKVTVVEIPHGRIKIMPKHRRPGS
tara:strand:- start:13 stop:198 length:186 start_codon:yes stop_codon:yes gene_type:complete